MRPLRAVKKLRMRAGAFLFDFSFRHLSLLGRLHPHANPARHGVELIRDVPYRPGALRAHTLDIYRPAHLPAGRPLPVVLYVHGGAFRILSKETHWMMGIAFARRGYLVFNINYRLAPLHPYPAAVEDACAALLWVARNAPRWGGDPSRIALAGESAGGNLVTAMAIACAMRRPEPWARAVFDGGIMPRAVLPACGMLQVSDAGRFARRKRKLSGFIADRIQEVEDAYLERARRKLAGQPGGVELADPLLLLESDRPTERPLPAFFAFVGTKDPLLDDTRRLHAALVRRRVPCEVLFFPGELHAFHAMVWRPQAIACWRRSLRWLDRTME